MRVPPYIPPKSALSRAPASALNKAVKGSLQRLTLPGYDRAIPFLYGEDRIPGLWLVRPYSHVGTGNLRFAILWSWGEIEGVQNVYLNGQSVSSGHMTHYTGTSGQTVNSKLSADIAGFADTYANLAYTVFDIPTGTYDGAPTTMQVEAVVRGIKVDNPAGGGTPETASARYWRVRITKTRTADAFFANLAEIQLRATVSGADQTGSGTASSSSNHDASTNAAKAFDDNASTFWSSAGGGVSPQWIQYDFGTSTEVKELYLQAGNSAARADRAPEDFSVQYSDDGSTWTTLDTFTGEAAWSSGESRTYTLSDVTPPATLYSENPARCYAHWLQSNDFGPGMSVTGLEDCADRCDELVGGVEVRCKFGLYFPEPQTFRAVSDVFSAHGEFLYSRDGESVLMVPDAPGATVATITPADIIEGTWRPIGQGLDQAPTEVTVTYRESSGTAEQWPQASESATAAGVDSGEVPAIRSDLDMPGVRRDSEALRKAQMRLRRLAYPTRYAWQAFDEGVKFQAGDIVDVTSMRGRASRLLRILSVDMVALGHYQITAERYDENMYPDDYTPGSTTTVPVGGILPYTGSGTPAGYADFSDANGRFLVGAGTTWARGATFGDTAFTISGTSTSVANHSTGSGTFRYQQRISGSGEILYDDVRKSAGGHAHDYSVTQDRTPHYAQTRLIVKTGTPGDVPTDAGVWADGDLVAAAYSALASGLGRLARAGTSTSTGGQQLTYNVDVGIVPAGGHNHRGVLVSCSTDVDSTNELFDATDEPDHPHSSSIPVTLSIPRLKLAHFIAGSTTEIVPGAIIGYDSDAALPAGWHDADGTNGTVDTREYWIERSSVGDAGTAVAGTRQATWSGTVNSGGEHDHKGARRLVGLMDQPAAHDTGEAHTHDVSGAVSYDPPSYAMRFIQYTGVA